MVLCFFAFGGSAVLTTCAQFSDKPSPMTDFPMREWSLKLFLLDEDGNERSADVFTKVVYNLHPTFENPVQSKSRQHSGLAIHCRVPSSLFVVAD